MCIRKPILEVEQIRDWDQYTIEKEPISSYWLMERAAQMATAFIVNNFSKDKSVLIYAGSGNNGGDGVAIARMLSEKGFDVHICIETFSKWSPDTQKNIQKLPRSVREIAKLEDFKYTKRSIVIDALFGSGLSRPVKGQLAENIEGLNQKPGIKIAIDTPSGLFADQLNDQDIIFKADYTLTFQVPKKVMTYDKSILFTGKVMVLPIGLLENYIVEQASGENWFLGEDIVIKPRPDYGHKGTFGKVSVVGGCYGTIGAPILAALSAFSVGAGLVALAVPKEYQPTVAAQYPHLMQLSVKGDHHMEQVQLDDKTRVVVVGPGLGVNETSKKLLKVLWKQQDVDFVVDADALNCIAKFNLSFPENSILTPHRKEMERLLGQTFEEEDALWRETARFAQEKNCFVILKSAHSKVFSPDGSIDNHLGGNSALAKGGSGDILAGVTGGLKAQGYTHVEAMNTAIEIQQHSARIFCKAEAPHALTPVRLIDNIGKAMKELY